MSWTFGHATADTRQKFVQPLSDLSKIVRLIGQYAMQLIYGPRLSPGCWLADDTDLYDLAKSVVT